MLINRLVAHACRVDPGQPAFVGLDGSEVGYAEFAEATRRVAGGIARLAPRPGATVGILALNSTAYLEVFLGAMWAGRVAVPLNARWSVKELTYAIDDAAIELLFVDDAFVPLVEPLQAAAPRLRQVVHLGPQPTPAGMLAGAAVRASAPADAAAVSAGTVAAVVYTGGTTGFPKGVMHTQGSLLASTANCLAFGMPARGSRYVLSVPLFHLGGYGLAFAQLMTGGTLVPLPTFRPDLVRTAVVERGADSIGVVPTMLGMLMDSPGFDPADYAGVRAFAYGASPMPVPLLRRVMATFPQAQLTQVYGMTEVGIATMLTDFWHREPHARVAAAGQPGPLYTVRIEDADGHELPRGQMGEVVFYGPAVMQGYLNRPEATREALRGGGMHSGDAGVMDEHGVITLLDRLKDMIVSGAENVYSVEVENAVARHPAVASCAVIGVPDGTYGERVHAVVVTRPGAALTLEELRSHCAALIAGYKCPRSLELRDSMPLSAMGKILKAELRAPHWAGHGRRVN